MRPLKEKNKRRKKVGVSILRRVARALKLDDAPGDLGPKVVFSLSTLTFRYLASLDRQRGREMSAPRTMHDRSLSQG